MIIKEHSYTDHDHFHSVLMTVNIIVIWTMPELEKKIFRKYENHMTVKISIVNGDSI